MDDGMKRGPGMCRDKPNFEATRTNGWTDMAVSLEASGVAGAVLEKMTYS